MEREPRSPIETLKEIIGLGEEEERLIRDVKSGILLRIDELVDGFIHHLDRSKNLVPSLEGKERATLRELQKNYLELLLGGRYDQEFLDKRMRLAAKLGALRPPSRWFPGGYGIYFELIPRIVCDICAGNGPRTALTITAVGKAFLLDMEIICHSCLGQTIESVQNQRDRLRAIVDDRTRRLRDTEKRYHELVQGYPEMIFAMNEGGLILDANRAALEYLGYDEEEARELTIHNLIAESHHPRIRMHFERMIVRGDDRTEARLLGRGGDEKHVELVSTAVRDEDGRYIGARIFARDRSQQMRLEEEMIRWERLVAVGSMAAKVAHEIRNPLSSISLNVELLLDEVRQLSDSDHTEATALVGSILSEIDRLTNVIEEYLTFGRLPSPSLETVSAEDFLRSIGEFVRPDMHEHGIDLSIEVRPGTPELHADRSQVRQSVLNLFRNAQEAMPSGGEIKVIAGVLEGNVVIEVRDTGVGIPKDEIRKIFDPFYTTKDYGTGLGLAFVQQVMREHGGRVTCRSEEEGGTTFTLHFPADSE